MVCLCALLGKEYDLTLLGSRGRSRAPRPARRALAQFWVSICIWICAPAGRDCQLGDLDSTIGDQDREEAASLLECPEHNVAGTEQAPDVQLKNR